MLSILKLGLAVGQSSGWLKRQTGVPPSIKSYGYSQKYLQVTPPGVPAANAISFD